jgi:hypothetical protein
MEMTGEHAVPAPADHVWKALNDPEMLKSCIPGCASIEPDGENAYRMAMTTRVGPVSARFTGKIHMSDIEISHAYTLHFEGSGGAVGFVNGEAHVTLSPGTEGTTTLTYVAKAHVGGKIAQVGSRLIDGAAHKLAADFFASFVEALSPPGEAPAPVVVRRSRVATYAVIGAAIIAVLAALYLIARR